MPFADAATKAMTEPLRAPVRYAMTGSVRDAAALHAAPNPGHLPVSLAAVRCDGLSGGSFAYCSRLGLTAKLDLTQQRC